MKTLLLKKSEVGSLIRMEDVISAVEAAYRAFCSGLIRQPPIMSIEIHENNGEIDFKSGYSEQNNLISLKLASGFFNNMRDLGIPNGLSTVCLSDGKTGALKCVMDGSHITGTRTGAAGAVSVKLLARKDASRIGVIGCGSQGRMQLRAMSKVMNISHISVWNLEKDLMLAYKADMEKELGVPVTICETAEDAVKDADIIVTTTPSKTPLIMKGFVRPGTHIVAVGADAEGKNELEPALFKGAKVVTDSMAQCVVRGETRNAVVAGVIAEADIHGQIGDILLGKIPGRENDTEITIFDTTGMAVQDLYLAAALYDAALKQGIGTFFEFMD